MVAGSGTATAVDANPLVEPTKGEIASAKEVISEALVNTPPLALTTKVKLLVFVTMACAVLWRESTRYVRGLPAAYIHLHHGVHALVS